MTNHPRRSKPRRKLLAVVPLLLVLGLVAGQAPAADAGAVPTITWVLRPGQAETDRYSWTEASQTMSGGSTVARLQADMASDHDPISGYPWPYCQPKNLCPMREGVFSTLSFTSAVGWTARNRLNSEDDQGARPALASDETTLGLDVVAAFVKQSSYYDKAVGSGPRSIFFIYNDNRGLDANWYYPAQELTSPNGQVDYPSIAIANGRIYLTWTNGKTGDIMLATSTDFGATWSMEIVGHTKRMAQGPYPYGAGGYEGRPALAVTDDGATVLVVFFKNDDAKLKAAVSITTPGLRQHGTPDWMKITLANAGTNPSPRSTNVPTADGDAGRLVTAWTDGTNVFTREFDVTGGVWLPRRTAATMPIGDMKSVDSTGVGIQGTGQTGVAFGGCLAAGCPIWGSARMGTDLAYVESMDNGASWNVPEVIKVHNDSSEFNNDEATVLLTGTTRYVRFNSSSKNAFQYELQTAVGTST